MRGSSSVAFMFCVLRPCNLPWMRPRIVTEEKSVPKGLHGQFCNINRETPLKYGSRDESVRVRVDMFYCKDIVIIVKTVKHRRWRSANARRAYNGILEFI